MWGGGVVAWRRENASRRTGSVGKRGCLLSEGVRRGEEQTGGMGERGKH